MTRRRTWLAFAALIAVTMGPPAIYLKLRSRDSPRSATSNRAALSPDGADALGNQDGLDPRLLTSLARLPTAGVHRLQVLFRYTGPGPAFGHLIRATTQRGAPPAIELSALSCDRIHFAAGSGICLTNRAYPATAVTMFDSALKARSTREIAGIASRARVSPDGAMAAYTVFVFGDSYATGRFSTRTAIVGTRGGDALLPDLERLSISRDSVPVQAAALNLWGVTFLREPGRFYATMQASGLTELIEGDVQTSKASVGFAGIECPSLSPAGTLIAFKRKISGTNPPAWRLAVVGRMAGSDHLLSETRSVDDQVEWFDDSHVLYAIPTTAGSRSPVDTWIAPINEDSAPQIFAPMAASLTVVRE